MQIHSVKLLIPISTTGSRIVCETILLKQTNPDEFPVCCLCCLCGMPDQYGYIIIEQNIKVFEYTSRFFHRTNKRANEHVLFYTQVCTDI